MTDRSSGAPLLVLSRFLQTGRTSGACSRLIQYFLQILYVGIISQWQEVMRKISSGGAFCL